MNNIKLQIKGHFNPKVCTSTKNKQSYAIITYEQKLFDNLVSLKQPVTVTRRRSREATAGQLELDFSA